MRFVEEKLKRMKQQIRKNKNKNTTFAYSNSYCVAHHRVSSLLSLRCFFHDRDYLTFVTWRRTKFVALQSRIFFTIFTAVVGRNTPKYTTYRRFAPVRGIKPSFIGYVSFPRLFQSLFLRIFGISTSDRFTRSEICKFSQKYNEKLWSYGGKSNSRVCSLVVDTCRGSCFFFATRLSSVFYQLIPAAYRTRFIIFFFCRGECGAMFRNFLPFLAFFCFAFFFNFFHLLCYIVAAAVAVVVAVASVYNGCWCYILKGVFLL